MLYRLSRNCIRQRYQVQFNINMASIVSSSKPPRGAFIVFEGIDRCGKSTQSELLGKALPNSENIRFPNRTSTIGQLINSYLASATNMSDQTIHLLFSANRWEADESIQKRLQEGTTLICDRYAFSGVAFSSAKGLSLDWCVDCDRGLTAPDAVIYLDMPVEDAVKRGDFGLERYEKKEFQEKVREKFLMLRELGSKCGTKSCSGDEAATGVDAAATSGAEMQWHTIDARQSVEALQAEIRRTVDLVLQRVRERDEPLKKLWV